MWLAPLADWGWLDTQIVVTAALAAMACTLPGNFLLLRRQSMMGDALSHSVLPGIAAAFLLVHALRTAGWITPETYLATWHAVVIAGAVLLGMLTAVLTEAVQKLGRVEASAAMGVVFTSLFAIGLILIRLAADRVHLDPACVLYGNLETAVMDTWGPWRVPRAAVVNGVTLLANLALVVACFKELRISAFDPALASTQGISSTAMHHALMSITAVTLVIAFETVGSILVIAVLIVPAATAYLVTDRLGVMIGLSLVFAAVAAVVGHALALTLPPLVFGPLGFERVRDASTAGMMAVACGLLFGGALLVSPRQGIVSRAVRQLRLALRIAAEDVLGRLYRQEEALQATSTASAAIATTTTARLEPAARPGWIARAATWWLRRRGWVVGTTRGDRLSETGRQVARELVRSHRLWESYLSTHFELSALREHRSAHQLEHYIDPALREELAQELGAPATDPHGRSIPPA